MYTIISVCNGGGYKYCKTIPEHPKANSNGLYPLHRVLMENKIGKSLLSNEDVHHVDGNKNNNSTDNLEILSKRDHAKKHIIVIPDIEVVCKCCYKQFKVKPHFYRLRINRNKKKEIYCSRSCGSKMSHINRL